MSLKKIDFLSPKITLYYYGSKRHKSVIGAIISLIMVLCSSLYIFYLFYSIIRHKISNFMFYKSYLTDAGLYIFNDTSGIYHYFQVYNIESMEFGEFDPKYIRIFMSRLYKTYQNNQSSLTDNEHWVYDKCREGIDNKNVNKNIFTEVTYFYRGACLRYYYNIEKQEYISIEDTINFKFPYLIHGSGTPGSLFLETVVEKCHNSSITQKVLGPCGSEEEIKKYLNTYTGIFLQLLEKQVITSNYEQPVYEYISGVAGALDNVIVPVNNIDIAPFYIDISKGIVFPSSKSLVTYFLEDIRREVWESNENNNILAIFDYWLQNSCQNIKGGYSTLYDILPSIGGIIQLIYYIFYCVNYLYNKYIVIHDCNKSFFRMYNSEDIQNSLAKKKFLKNIHSIRDEVNYKNLNKIGNVKRNTIYKDDLKAIRNKEIIKHKYKKRSFKTEVNTNKNFINCLKNNNNLINMSNSNDLIFSGSKNINYNDMNNIKMLSNSRVSILKGKKGIFESNSKKKEELRSNYYHESDKENCYYYQFSNHLKEFINQKRKTFKTEPLNEEILQKFITFFNYLMSFTGNEYRKRAFEVLSTFREKLLGEEHFFRLNIFLYHLEKYFNIKETAKIDILELYENL